MKLKKSDLYIYIKKKIEEVIMSKLGETRELQNEKAICENDIINYKDQVRKTQKGLTEIKVSINYKVI